MTGDIHLRDAAWLRDGAVARLLALLDRDGEEARVVGGAVRNALLNMPVEEVDVATTALPEEVVRRVEAAGCKAVPTGIAHGTVTVIVEHTPVEVTTLREDVETFGRKARVAFGRDWKADAERRDFTINALSARADGTVFDYVGGLADIAARRVRFIGDPLQRIAEDYLRILRFFRFQAWFGGGPPEAAGLHACIASRAGLETLSRERVRMELLKLLLAPRATATLAAMAESGLLGMVLGGVPLLAGFENMVKVEDKTGTAPDAVRRLGALAVWVAEDAERLAQRLRLANAETERLEALEGWWRVAPAAGEPAAHALLYQFGAQSYVDRVLVAWTRSSAGAADTAWSDLATLPQRWTAPVFPLKAADFFRRGMTAGPALGAAMRAAEEAWIAADFPGERAAVEAIADGAMRTA
jgi:poly(A) polymerase